MQLINNDGTAQVGGFQVVREYPLNWRDGAIIKVEEETLPWVDAEKIETTENGNRVYTSKFTLPDGKIGVWVLNVGGPDWSERTEWIGLKE